MVFLVIPIHEVWQPKTPYYKKCKKENFSTRRIINLINNNDNEYSKLHILGWAHSAVELEALKSDDSRHCFAQTAALLFKMYCTEVQSKHTETWKQKYCFFVLIG